MTHYQAHSRFRVPSWGRMSRLLRRLPPRRGHLLFLLRPLLPPCLTVLSLLHPLPLTRLSLLRPRSRLPPMKNSQLITLTAPTCRCQMHQRKARLPLPLSSSVRPLNTTVVIHVPQALMIFKMSQQRSPRFNLLALRPRTRAPSPRRCLPLYMARRIVHRLRKLNPSQTSAHPLPTVSPSPMPLAQSALSSTLKL